ncbi:LLM class flavin-dependent oxidoreductase [Clostridium botulinum]|nr:LLM class flavin-dependent oxidoreductase [Clostridium botulinum]
MELKDEIKAYIVSSGWSITDLNKELNKLNNTEYTVQNLSSKIRKGSLKYSEILQIADIIGYEIEWNRKKD